MEKRTAILLFLAAVVGVIVTVAFFAMTNPQVGAAVSGFLTWWFIKPFWGVVAAFNVWLENYPALWVGGAFLFGGLVLAVIINSFALPKLRHTKKVTEKQYMGAPPVEPTMIKRAPTETELPTPTPTEETE